MVVKKHIKVLLVVIVVITVLLAVFQNLKELETIPNFGVSAKGYYISTAFQGRVKNKFLDGDYHYSRTIRIQSSNDSVHFYVDDFDRSGFYQFVQPGDSIRKDSGELVISLFRGDFDTTFTILLD